MTGYRLYISLFSFADSIILVRALCWSIISDCERDSFIREIRLREVVLFIFFRLFFFLIFFCWGYFYFSCYLVLHIASEVIVCIKQLDFSMCARARVRRGEGQSGMGLALRRRRIRASTIRRNLRTRDDNRERMFRSCARMLHRERVHISL